MDLKTYLETPEGAAVAKRIGATRARVWSWRHGQRPGVDMAVELEKASRGCITAVEALGLVVKGRRRPIRIRK